MPTIKRSSLAIIFFVLAVLVIITGNLRQKHFFLQSSEVKVEIDHKSDIEEREKEFNLSLSTSPESRNYLCKTKKEADELLDSILTSAKAARDKRIRRVSGSEINHNDFNELVEVLPHPWGFQAAVAVSVDADSTSLEEHDATIGYIRRELKLDIANSLWLVSRDTETISIAVQDERGKVVLREPEYLEGLIKRYKMGEFDTLHSLGSFRTDRAGNVIFDRGIASDLWNLLERFNLDINVWTDHGNIKFNPDNVYINKCLPEKIRGRSDSKCRNLEAGHKNFHLDYFMKNIDYVRRHGNTVHADPLLIQRLNLGLVTQKTTFSAFSHVVLREKGKKNNIIPLWHPLLFNIQTHPEILNRIVESGASTIFVQHFGTPNTDSQGLFSCFPKSNFPAPLKEGLLRLKKYQDDKKIIVLNLPKILLFEEVKAGLKIDAIIKDNMLILNLHHKWLTLDEKMLSGISLKIKKIFDDVVINLNGKKIGNYSIIKNELKSVNIGWKIRQAL